MLDRFDLDKLYLFSKEKYRQYTGKIKPLAELLDKRIVDVEDEWTGIITVGGEDYIVFPHSCIEISPEVYSDESGNIYNEIEDKQEEQDENSIASFLDKLLSLDLSDNEEEERYDDKLDKFDMNNPLLNKWKIANNDGKAPYGYCLRTNRDICTINDFIDGTYLKELEEYILTYIVNKKMEE